MTYSTKANGRNRKLAALAAGAAVIAIGATYTLATWNDSEWVWGGFDDEPSVGTSYFNVQQDTTPGAGGEFVDFEDNPGDELRFSAGALALSPGDTVYAPVALQTASGSVAGEITLQSAVVANGITFDDEDDLLWDAIALSVFTSDDAAQPDCDTDFDPSDWTELAGIFDLSSGTSDTQALAQDAGSIQHYCFVLTLDVDPQNENAKELMGRTIAPAWEFAAESIDD